jgi:hypothetical protein
MTSTRTWPRRASLAAEAALRRVGNNITAGTQQILNHTFAYTVQKSTMSGQAVSLVTLE